MKRLLTDFTMFAAMAVIFSLMTGCGNSVETANKTSANNSAANSVAQKKVSSSDFPPLATGLADADVAMLDGTKFKISDKKGKVLLVNIWGTWCGPCIAEMPHLIELQNKHGDQGFEVIGLNIGDGSGTPEPLDDIKEFVAKQKLNYTIAIASNAVTNQFYQITKKQVVPQTMLVDREGKLRGVFVGGGPRIFDSLKQNVEKVVSES